MVVKTEEGIKSVDNEGNITELTDNDKEEFEQALNSLAIRKLTPEECFILQGMTVEDCEKARSLGVSDSKLYEQAGNGLTTSCVQFIIEHLKKMYRPDYVTTDEKMVERYGVAE